MKIRTGFVSNSSSSSFMAVGYELSGNANTTELVEALIGGPVPEDEYEGDMLDRAGWTILQGDHYTTGKQFVGKYYHIDEYSLRAVDFNELAQVAAKLQALIGKYIVGPLKVVSGTRYC